MKYVAGVAGLVMMLVGHAVCAKEILPNGWAKAGSDPSSYTIAIKPTHAYKDHSGAIIRSKNNNSKGFGVLMQTILADDYRGQRVRFSGYLRTQDVSRRAGLWLRIDGPNGGILGFDNMKKRSLHGSVPWKSCDIVMDIPNQAQTIAFGALLSGAGQAWVSDLKFEIVGKAVPVTAKTASIVYPRKPTNLNFK
jgi:hypothetical protein